MKRNTQILAVILAAMAYLLAGCGGSAVQAAPTTQEAPESAARLAQTLAADATSVQSDEPPYADVPADAWYAEAVRYVKERGLMNGTGNDKFSPDEPFTRAQLATVLYRIAGEPSVSGEDSFTDTEPGAWYAPAVLWAQRQGVVNGVGGGLFGTNSPVTQEQMATMLYRMQGEPEAASASDASPYAVKAVGWARENGIAPATADYTFTPKADATRAQIAVLLYGYLTQQNGGEAADGSGKTESKSTRIRITAGEYVLYADFEDNSSTRALIEQMPLTLPMMNLYGREMCYRMGSGALPAEEAHSTGYEIGDISYWPPAGSLVILYKQNGEVFEQQPIGHIREDVSFFDGMPTTDITFELAE